MDDMRIQARLSRATGAEEVGVDRSHVPARVQDD